MRYSRVRQDRTGLTMVIMTRGGMFLLVLFTSVLANEHDHRYEVRGETSSLSLELLLVLFYKYKSFLFLFIHDSINIEAFKESHTVNIL